MENDEMGETHSTYGRNQKCMPNFSRNTWREGNTWSAWTYI